MRDVAFICIGYILVLVFIHFIYPVYMYDYLFFVSDTVSVDKINKPSIEVKVSTPNSDHNGIMGGKTIQSYIQMSGDNFDNEHTAYEMAKRQLLKQSHDQITKVGILSLCTYNDRQ